MRAAVGYQDSSYSSEMFPAPPTSWTSPPTMDFTYDGLYNSLTPSGYNSSFPAVLSQTLGELDIDNSILKLFEGLPDIFEDHSSIDRDVDALRDAVVPAVTMASLVFPSTPPAHVGSRPSSMPVPGSLVVPQEFVNPMHGSLATRPGPIPVVSMARNVNATPQQQPVQIRPNGGPEWQQPVTVAADRKVGRARKSANAAARGRGESKAPAAKSKVLEAIPVPTSQAPSIVSAVACMVPKILPATAMPAVDLSPVKVNEHVALPHPLGLGPQVCFRALKRSRKPETVQMANTRTQKTRYFDKVEHIVRERWRRDDMAGKFLALESLLPPSTKRDRSTIVEDSMKLVKSLQHRKEEALKRRAELKQALVTATQSPGPKLSRIIQKISSLAVILPQHHGSVQQQAGRDSAAAAAVPGPPSCNARPLDDSSVQMAPKLLSDCVLRFYVHSEVTTGDIVVEMVCEQIPNFHSALLKSMESLGLEVVRCSITRIVNKLICNITVKPFPSAASVNSPSSSILEGLSSAFQKET